ncbi:MAG: hypothetical protein WCE44_10270 [Candidatus Velthaea sp.]
MLVLNLVRAVVILIGFALFAYSWRLERFQWGGEGHDPIRDANAFSLRLGGAVLIIVTLMTWVIAYGPVDFTRPFNGH